MPAKSGAPLAIQLAWSALVGFAVVVPLGLWVGPFARSVAALVTAAGICALSVAIYAVYRNLRLPEGEAWELRRQTAAGATAVLIWFPIYLVTRP